MGSAGFLVMAKVSLRGVVIDMKIRGAPTAEGRIWVANFLLY